MESNKVGIVGSGLIGRSWAMLFAAAGYDVVLYDVMKSQLDDAMISIKTLKYNVTSFVQNIFETPVEKFGLLRGCTSANSQFDSITTTENLTEAVADTVHMQECVPEKVDLKMKVLSAISDACTSEQTVISSSTSCILPSKIFSHLARVSQCIVAHPCNPPYYCPMTEIVPHPKTSTAVIQNTKALMSKIGQTPVMLNKEVDGFGANRIQYAIMNEAWRLVADGVMSPQDVDKIFTDGLGMRYAFIGPFETIHLNAEGTRNYMEKYSESIQRVSKTFGPVPTYDGKTLDLIDKEITSAIPSNTNDLEKKRTWRDERLFALSALKRNMNSKQGQ